MHSGGFELTELTYTRLEENLIRHQRGTYLLPATLVTFLFLQLDFGTGHRGQLRLAFASANHSARGFYSMKIMIP